MTARASSRHWLHWVEASPSHGRWVSRSCRPAERLIWQCRGANVRSCCDGSPDPPSSPTPAPTPQPPPSPCANHFAQLHHHVPQLGHAPLGQALVAYRQDAAVHLRRKAGQVDKVWANQPAAAQGRHAWLSSCRGRELMPVGASGRQELEHQFQHKSRPSAHAAACTAHAAELPCMLLGWINKRSCPARACFCAADSSTATICSFLGGSCCITSVFMRRSRCGRSSVCSRSTCQDAERRGAAGNRSVNRAT